MEKAQGVAEKDLNRRTAITLSVSARDKMRVKIYATKNGTTVSDLLHRWIEEKCPDLES